MEIKSVRVFTLVNPHLCYLPPHSVSVASCIFIFCSDLSCSIDCLVAYWHGAGSKVQVFIHSVSFTGKVASWCFTLTCLVASILFLINNLFTLMSQNNGRQRWWPAHIKWFISVLNCFAKKEGIMHESCRMHHIVFYVRLPQAYSIFQTVVSICWH